jgi:hypothetical protein
MLSAFWWPSVWGAGYRGFERLIGPALDFREQPTKKSGPFAPWAVGTVVGLVVRQLLGGRPLIDLDGGK